MFQTNHSNLTLGYCTNVHAGTDIETIRENLTRYAGETLRKLGVETSGLGVGLWIPHQAANELKKVAVLSSFNDFLNAQKLVPFTINGFPYDNFHQAVVKRKVYVPGWWSETRRLYTEQLAVSLARLLPNEWTVGSISTLPLGWPQNPEDPMGKTGGDQTYQLAGENLRKMASFLESLEQKTGRRIVVAIEPEPGCCLDTAPDMVQFFESELSAPIHRRYITICHDICHSAVMMESQADVLRQYAQAEIALGKIQVSSAIVADWQSIDDDLHGEVLNQLSQFAEDRYLHQTGRRLQNGAFQLEDDLPELISTPRGQISDDRWVIHFHVPIFLKEFGHLKTSQEDVLDCLRTILGTDVSGRGVPEFTGHLEVETYAWSVLPESMRQSGLAADVAKELQWLYDSIVQIETSDSEPGSELSE